MTDPMTNHWEKSRKLIQKSKGRHRCIEYTRLSSLQRVSRVICCIKRLWLGCKKTIKRRKPHWQLMEVVQSCNSKFRKHQINFLVLNKLSWSSCLSDEYQNKPHFGTQYILLTLKEKFCLKNVRLPVKQVIRNCMVRRRRNTKITQPCISDLHCFRVEHGNPPSQKSGVKFFATVSLKQM